MKGTPLAEALDEMNPPIDDVDQRRPLEGRDGRGDLHKSRHRRRTETPTSSREMDGDSRWVDFPGFFGNFQRALLKSP